MTGKKVRYQQGRFFLLYKGEKIFLVGHNIYPRVRLQCFNFRSLPGSAEKRTPELPELLWRQLSPPEIPWRQFSPPRRKFSFQMVVEWSSVRPDGFYLHFWGEYILGGNDF